MVVTHHLGFVRMKKFALLQLGYPEMISKELRQICVHESLYF